jgi:hypothetical protein
MYLRVVQVSGLAQPARRAVQNAQIAAHLDIDDWLTTAAERQIEPARDVLLTDRRASGAL